jgi:dihydroflavonol-4-reductase
VKYLVTGATGFLGSHVAEALESSGYEVSRMARSTGGDVLDAAAVQRAATGCVGAFHCAGRVSRRSEDAEAMYRLHVEGTKTILDACASARVSRVVVASTSGTIAVSDDPKRVATEKDAAPIAIISRWPYYRAKLFAERAALSRNREGFDVVCVNPSLLLGPGDLRGSSTGDVRAFLEGEIPLVPSGGLSFVDVRDVADAMCAAMKSGRAGERYLLGACNLSMREFMGKLGRISGTRVPVFGLPRSRELVRFGVSLLDGLPRPLAPRSADTAMIEMASYFWYLDASKAEVELGFRARDPNVTLHDTVEDLRARGVVWPRPEDSAFAPSTT